MEVLPGVLAVIAICALVAFAIGRTRRSHGAADSVAQLIASRDAAFLTVEQRRPGGGGRIQSPIEGRLSLRTPRDGAPTVRRDVPGTLKVLAVDDRGSWVCSDAERPLHVRDADTLDIASDVAEHMGGLAPFASLDPRIEDDALTVLDRAGVRRSTRDVLGRVRALPTPERADVRLVGAPRAHLERRGRRLGDTEVLNGRPLGSDAAGGVIVIAERDLTDREAVVVRVDAEGRRVFATPLGRRAEVAHWTLAADLLVLAILADRTSPLELIAIELGSGALRWRRAA